MVFWTRKAMQLDISAQMEFTAISKKLRQKKSKKAISQDCKITWEFLQQANDVAKISGGAWNYPYNLVVLANGMFFLF